MKEVLPSFFTGKVAATESLGSMLVFDSVVKAYAVGLPGFPFNVRLTDPVEKTPDVAVAVSLHAARVPIAPRPRTMPSDATARVRLPVNTARVRAPTPEGKPETP